MSTRERGPSARPLSGVWWREHKVNKVLYARNADGVAKVTP